MGFVVHFAREGADNAMAFDADAAWFSIDPNTIVLTVDNGLGREYQFPPERWVSIEDDSPESRWWNRETNLTTQG
jgi:hypothetical protein